MGTMRAVLVVGLLVGARAFACSGLTCEAVVVPVPKAGSTIPSNAPAVGVQRTVFSDVLVDGGIEHSTQTAEPLVLRGPDGGLVTGLGVDTVIGVFVATTLVEGSWSMVLEESSSCRVDTRFSVGRSAPLPTVAGAVSLVETLFFPQGTSGCTGAFPAQQIARLRIDASPEMIPWLPLARWEVEVDGANVATSGFGRVSEQPLDFTPNPWFRTFNSFAVQCGLVLDAGVVGPDPRYLQPGLHEVKVLARILGVSTPILTNVLQVDVPCTPPAEDAGVDEGIDAGSSADAGSRVGPAPSGCSTATGLEFFGLTVVLMRRRRQAAASDPGRS